VGHGSGYKRGNPPDRMNAQTAPDTRPAARSPQPPDAPPRLQIDALTQRYGERTALKALSFTVQPGTFVALLGPNGAGKSTLFQVLTGLFAADEGDVRVDGHSLRGSAVAALRHIGVVFQAMSLDLDLSADLRRLVRELSGGNRRKVELVRALLHRPSLVLMDEPTVGLDPKSRRDLRNAIHDDVRQRGSSVLWATHLVEEAEAADRVLVLHKGQLLADGTPAEVVQALGGGSLEEAFIRATG
jgi:ABC-2 type transport system ATP-binding protein